MSKKKSVKKPLTQAEITLHLSKADYICMSICTLIFLILVFINIGKNYAPETSMKFTQDGNHELIIDFGDYINVDHMDVFSGYLDNRKVALSAFNEVTNEWMVFNDDANISSVFTWNNIYLGYYLRYLGIVFLDNEASINEIVFYSPEGDIITPANASEYPEMFDEQSMHPDSVSFLDGTMFDEIYHGRTAYEILNGIPIYETTHPHLGKILISLGIALFGMNPFGWRFMVAVLGTCMIPVMYIFAKRLSKDTFIASCTTLLLVFDFMHFSLSRISTIDIPVALFILMMYYFMYAYLDQPVKDTKYAYRLLILSGISMAFGVATKFTGIYAGAGLGIIFIGYHIINFKKNFADDNSKGKLIKLAKTCVTFFIIVPFIIYTLAFMPIVEYGQKRNLLARMFYGTKSMIEYHANQDATHYYSSPWYSWIIDAKPLMLTHCGIGTDKMSTISEMGNPVIYWAIIPCLIFMLYQIIRYKDGKATFLMLAYLAQYVPWIPITRCLFIYHYFGASLFGMLIVGYTFSIIFKKWPKSKYAICAFILTVIALFIIFYPVVSGLPVSQDYLFKLKWLPKWVITY